VKTKMIPIAALITIPKGPENNLKKVATTTIVSCFRKLHSWEEYTYLEGYMSLARTALGEC